jgi:hypothetical protein
MNAASVLLVVLKHADDSVLSEDRIEALCPGLWDGCRVQNGLRKLAAGWLPMRHMRLQHALAVRQRA